MEGGLFGVQLDVETSAGESGDELVGFVGRKRGVGGVWENLSIVLVCFYILLALKESMLLLLATIEQFIFELFNNFAYLRGIFCITDPNQMFQPHFQPL